MVEADRAWEIQDDRLQVSASMENPNKEAARYVIVNAEVHFKSVVFWLA